MLVSSALPEGTWTNYTNGNFINDIALDGDFIWCATSVGVVRWDKRDGTYSKYPILGGLTDNNVHSVAVDSENVKWFGTEGGVSSFDDGKISKHSRKHSPEETHTKLNESDAGNDMRTLLEQKIKAWRDNLPPDAKAIHVRSNVDFDHLTKYSNNYIKFHNMVKLGPRAIPYLLEKIENESYFVYLYVLYHITKWRGDNLKFANHPTKLMFGKVEGKGLSIRRGKSPATEFWNRWWNEFRPNIKQHFEKRYSEWKTLKNENKTEEVEKKYQRIVVLGIDAIPYLVEKISEGDSEFIDALSFLTDGDLKSDATASETVKWWYNNKEKWTIPDIKINKNPDYQTEVKKEKLPTEKEYKNEKYGFKVFVPKNWVPHIYKKAEKSSRWLIAYGLPKVWGDLEKQFIENAVSVAVYENIISLESLVEIENNRIKDMLISKQKINFQKGKAFIVYTQISGLKYKTKYYLIHSKGKGFTLSFTSTRGTYDKNIGLFERFVETFRFNDSSSSDKEDSPKIPFDIKETEFSESDARDNIRALLEKLDLPEVFKKGNLRKLLESRPMHSLILDNDLVWYRWGEREIQRKLKGIRTTDGSWGFVYTPEGHDMVVQLNELSGDWINSWWFNPRTGETTFIDKIDRRAVMAFFEPTGKPEPGNDWGIILCDASKDYDVPEFSQTEKEHYESKIILDLKWGDGPEEIGLRPSVISERFDGPGPIGPTSFEVDSNGLIYILDAYRSRCAVFNQKGKLVRSFEVGTDRNGGTDMDKDNNLWVVNGHGYTASKYSSEGILKQKITFNREPKGYYENGVIIREGEIFLTLTDSKLEIDRLVTTSGNKGVQVFSAKKIELSKRKQARRIGRTSKRFYESPYSYEIGKNIIRVTEENGDVREIFISNELSFSASFLDEDSNGNSYCNFGNYKDKVYQIWKYNPNLELLAKINILPSSVFDNTQKWQNIDDEGNIYMMFLKEKTGVQIMKWSLKTE